MKSKTVVIALVVFLSLAVLYSPNAFALTYYLWDDWGGTYSDAEKSSSNTEDDSMCWAAAASNILAWTGWGYTNGLSSADGIFTYFQDHWTDAGGSAYYAWDWWFDGTNVAQGVSGWSQVDVEGGGFYLSEDYGSYVLFSDSDVYAANNLVYLLQNGYGTALSVTDGVSDHAITCWGYEYDEYGNIIGIYITDSDDDKDEDDPADELMYYALVYRGGAWYLQDFYNYDTWYITEVMGLDQMPDSEPVPEPATLLLLGSGMVGMVTAKRQRRK